MNKTGKKLLPLALAILAGAAGGFMRGKELTTCYDDSVGLYQAAPVTWCLLGLCLAAVLFCLAAALAKPKDERDFTALYRCGTACTLLGVLGGALTALAGLLRIMSFFESARYSAFLIGLLTLLAGAAMIALTAARKRGEVPYTTGFGAVVIVFWGCFMLIQVFMEHPVEPVILLFIYDLLAMCMALAALYGCTAQIFDKKRARMTLFCALGAVYFLLVSGLGRFSVFLYTGSLYYVMQVGFRLMIYAALFAYCVSLAASLLLHIGAGAEEPSPADGGETEQEEENEV